MQDDADWQASVELDTYLGKAESTEIAVIPMMGAPQTVDYIEFHFARPLSREQRLELEALVPTIERSWAGRKPGLVTQAAADEGVLISRRPRSETRTRFDEALLGMSNPANLSRAEFRVCLLLSRGLSVKAVTDELALSENTVRSHLRAIYSKTETSGLSELIYRILSTAPEDHLADIRANRA
jgi:DNA-binding CsgD family transcriptional regulator